VYLLLGGIAWSAIRFRHAGLSPTQVCAGLARWHLVPLLGCAAYFAGFVLQLGLGGGDLEPAPAVMARALALATGLPSWLGTAALLGFGALVLGAGCLHLAHRGDDIWAFYLVATLASPAVALTLQRHSLQYERYHLMAAASFLLLAGTLLSRVARRHAALAWGLVAACWIGQAPRLYRLTSQGRGQYSAALHLVLSESPGPDPVSIASDNDFRNQMVIAYHGAHLRGGDRLRYVPNVVWASNGSTWFVAHRPADVPGPGPDIQDAAGRHYRLRATFESAPLSGFTWFVYRRAS
jgi:hypothetical protein